MSTVTRPLIDSATLVMGDTGTGKTALVGTYARWLWKTHKKVTLVYGVDPGGCGDFVKSLIPRGIVRYWNILNRTDVAETLSLITRGYWPLEWDPTTGKADPNVPLIAPLKEVWTLFCPVGHPAFTASFEAGLKNGPCPKCKKVVSKQTPGTKVTRSSQPQPGFENVGGWAVDGLTGMEEHLMEWLAKQAITQAGGVSRAGNVIKSGSLQWGQVDRPHYGFAQNRVPEWIKNSINIPFLWAPPLFTALENKIDGDEKANQGMPFYGPKIAGNAKTGDVPRLIGNCLGTRTIIDEKTGKPEWRLYLYQWRGEDKIPHLCKIRAKSLKVFEEVAPEGYLADKAGEEEYSTFNLGVFYDHLYKGLADEKKRVEEEFGDAPGLPSGKLDGAVVVKHEEETNEEEENKTTDTEAAGPGVTDGVAGSAPEEPGGEVLPNTKAVAKGPTVVKKPSPAPIARPPVQAQKAGVAAAMKGAPPIKAPQSAPVKVKKG